MGEDFDENKITLRLMGASSVIYEYVFNKKVPMKYLMDDFAMMVGSETSEIYFYSPDGRIIEQHQTPYELQLEDGAFIGTQFKNFYVCRINLYFDQ